MNVSPFAFELAVAIVLILAVAAWTLSFVLRSGEGTAEPIIRARAKELQKGWYQVDMRIANRAPYGLTGVSLRRIRPRAARLLAPITSVSTRKGKFQVWSDPSTDIPETSIPLHLEVGPHEERLGIAAPGTEAQATAWLFLPEKRDVADLTLELAFIDRAKNLRRFSSASFSTAWLRLLASFCDKGKEAVDHGVDLVCQLRAGRNGQSRPRGRNRSEERAHADA